MEDIRRRGYAAVLYECIMALIYLLSTLYRKLPLKIVLTQT